MKKTRYYKPSAVYVGGGTSQKGGRLWFNLSASADLRERGSEA